MCGESDVKDSNDGMDAPEPRANAKRTSSVIDTIPEMRNNIMHREHGIIEEIY
jgi:hypothetical protein